VTSDWSKKSNNILRGLQEVQERSFHQPLILFVEQGTRRIVIDILDRGGVIATLPLDIVDTILRPAQPLKPEMVYLFKTKSKRGNVLNPRAQLTIHVNTCADVEQGFVENCSTETDILVRQHLLKTKKEVDKITEHPEMDDIQVLKESCRGPIERIVGLGKYEPVYAGVVGPPTSRHWIFGLWSSKEAFDAGKNPTTEVDLLKIEAVTPDPSRIHVFQITFMDQKRTKHQIQFRRIDRNRDVWVECLRQLIRKGHEWKTEEKKQRQKTRKG
jgi:hypothetical protein